MDADKFLSFVRPSLIRRIFANCINLDWEIKLLLILPLVLLCINDSWLFLDISEIDSWVYLGYFIDLKQHLNTFAGTYYGTRLPWILPGFLAYQLFSPAVAHYVLHLAYYYAAVISLYLILKNMIDRRTALLTTVLMSTYFSFLGALGHNYIDGAAVTYLLLALLMLTFKESHPRPQLRLMMAGVFYGCLIYTQLFLIVYTPLLVLYHLFIRRENQHLTLIQSFKYIIYGFVGISLLLCTINYCFSGVFFFFMPIIKWSTNFVCVHNPWWIPIAAFWKQAWWLLFPIITFLGGLFFLISQRNNQLLISRLFLMFSQLFFIANLLMFVMLDLVIKQPVLSLTYYSSYLIPAMFLAMGSQLSVMISGLSQRRFYLLVGLALVISFFSYVVPIQSNWKQPLYLSLLPIIIGITGFLIKPYYYHEVKVVLLSISLTMINIFGMHNRVFQSTHHGLAPKQSFLSVIENARSILSMDPEIKALFWYNGNEPSGFVFRSIASLNLWGYRLINEQFPKISGESVNPTACRFHLHDRIFLFSNQQNATVEANKSLAQFGLIGKPINEKTIQHDSMSFKITLIEVSSLEK